MKETVTVIIIIVLIFLGFLLFVGGEKSNVSENLLNNSTDGVGKDNNKILEEKFDKAQDFSLEDIDGNIVSLSNFDGKTLVINSWATWCPFCVKELADFGELQKEFPDKIVMIAVNRQESLEKSVAFTDNLGVTEEMLYLLDPKDSFYKSIGGFSMPETIFVDREGNIRIHKRGPIELDEMISLVNSIIN